MADVWYFFDGAKKLGPFSLVELRRLLEDQGSPEVRVWREGLAEWTAPVDLPELAPVRPPPLPPEALEDSATDRPTRQSRFNNFVAKNWRGEFSLATSYWGFGFLGNLFAGALAAGIVAALESTDYQPTTLFAGTLFTWLAIAGTAIWQCVGVWRSADRHIKARALLGKRSTWAGLAKVAVVLGVLRLASTFITSGAPQLMETGRMSFLGDPDIPDYSIRVMRNGTEAEIAGGFKYGLTSDFLRVLDASPQLKVLHLDSVGGRVGEAVSLNKVIRSRHLDTYVSSQCMSACTVAFAAGTRRILKKDAVLGFHASTFPGMTKARLAEASNVQRDAFLAAGFDRKFVDQAVSTPNATIWNPEVAELRNASVITDVSDGSDFALSGIGTLLTRNDMEALLSKVLPLLEPLKRRFPKDYESVVQVFFESYVNGKTEVESRSAGHVALFAVIKRLQPLADDDVLVDIAAMYANEYDALGIRSVAQCYQFASGVGLTALPELPAKLVAQENSVNKRVIETANVRPPASSTSLDPIWKKIEATVRDSGITADQFALFTAATVPSEKYGDYCTAATSLFRVISGLPRSEAAAIMRSILADN